MTNKPNCPVCGEVMKAIEGEGVYYCANDKCKFGGIYSETEIYTMNASIQSRIDKAVQDEKERLEGLLEAEITNVKKVINTI